MENPKTCSLCGSAPSVTLDEHGWWLVICECYDGAPDNPHRNDFGHEPRLESAVNSWNDIQDQIDIREE